MLEGQRQNCTREGFFWQLAGKLTKGLAPSDNGEKVWYPSTNRHALTCGLLKVIGIHEEEVASLGNTMVRSCCQAYTILLFNFNTPLHAIMSVCLFRMQFLVCTAERGSGNLGSFAIWS